MQNNNVFVTIEAASAPVGALVIRYLKVEKIQKVRAKVSRDDMPSPEDFEPDWRVETHIQVVSSADEISKTVLEAKEHFQQIRHLEKAGQHIATPSTFGITGI